MGVFDFLKRSVGTAVESVKTIVKPRPKPTTDINRIRARIDEPFSAGLPTYPEGEAPEPLLLRRSREASRPAPAPQGTQGGEPPRPMPVMRPRRPRPEPGLVARTLEPLEETPIEPPLPQSSPTPSPAQAHVPQPDLSLIRSEIETMNERLKVIEAKIDKFSEKLEQFDVVKE